MNKWGICNTKVDMTDTVKLTTVFIQWERLSNINILQPQLPIHAQLQTKDKQEHKKQSL